ncbi:MAG: hypothetical protein NY202_02550 [Mollicutes bacterium UO1]
MRETNKLQAQITKELQEKIDEAKEAINAPSQVRVSLLKVLRGFNEEWAAEGENDLVTKARASALMQKKLRLAEAIRDLSKKEIQLI